MSKEKTLMLFTKTFPYGKGEQYLADELHFLAQAFKKVIIIPCSVFDEEVGAPKATPVNCEVFLVNRNLAQRSFFRKISDRFDRDKIVSEEVTGMGGDVFNRISDQDKAILNQQMACAYTIEKYLKEKAENMDDYVFYSYWMHSGAIILGLLKRKGVILTFASRAHSYDLYHKDFITGKEKSPLPWEYFKFNSTGTIYCISEHGANHLKRKFPDFEKKIKVARLGVSDQLEQNPEKSEEGVFRIVTCSTIQHLKRLFIIPEIISHLDFAVEWVHFGTGSEEDMSKVDEAWKGSAKNIHKKIFMGFTPNESVMEYYRSTHIDLFVNVSLAEGVPVSLMEAASFGIPLLASDVYGNREVAQPAQGIVIPKLFEPAKVAKEITGMKNNAERQKSMREKSLETQRTLFNAEKNYIDFIVELTW